MGLVGRQGVLHQHCSSLTPGVHQHAEWQLSTSGLVTDSAGSTLLLFLGPLEPLELVGRSGWLHGWVRGGSGECCHQRCRSLALTFTVGVITVTRQLQNSGSATGSACGTLLDMAWPL